jgi:hypothetical protein
MKLVYKITETFSTCKTKILCQMKLTNTENHGWSNYTMNEENNQQNALINSSINLLMSDHSDIFRLPSTSTQTYSHNNILADRYTSLVTLKD